MHSGVFTPHLWGRKLQKTKKFLIVNRHSLTPLSLATHKEAVEATGHISHPHFHPSSTMEVLIGSDGLLNSILQIGGSTVPARTRFIASTIATTTYSSLTFGLFSGLVGAITPFGPLVPFLSGCWMGYSLGVYSVWRSAKSLAVRCAERYQN